MNPKIWLAIGVGIGVALMLMLACIGFMILGPDGIQRPPVMTPARTLEAMDESRPSVTLVPVTMPERAFSFEDRASSLHIQYILDASDSMMEQLADGPSNVM